MRHFIKQHRSLFLFLFLAGLSSLAAGGAWLGNQLQLGQYSAASTFPAASSTNIGSLVFDTDDAGVWVSDGVGWRPVGGGSNLPVTGSNSFFYDGGLNPVTGNLIWMQAGALLLGHEDGGIAMDGGEFAILQQGSLRISTGNSLSPTQLDGGPAIALYTNKTGFVVDPSSTAGGVASKPYFSDIIYGSAGSAMFTQSWWGQQGNGIPVFDGALIGGQGISGNYVQGLNWVVPSGHPMAWLDNSSPTPLLKFKMQSTGEMDYYQSTGQPAIAFQTNGARLDFGTGTNDFFSSNGTNITTPAGVISTQDFSAGSSFNGYSLSLFGDTLSNYTATNSALLLGGSVSWNTSLDQLWTSAASGVVTPSAGVAFKPIAADHPVFDRQSFSTRLLGASVASFPEIVEKIPCFSFGGTAAYLQMFYGPVGAAVALGSSATLVGNRPYLAIQSTDGTAIANAYPACSSAASTFASSLVFTTPTVGKASYCQRLAMGPSVASGTTFVAFTNGVSTHGNTNFNANRGEGFRYRGGTDTNWTYCNGNATTTTCTATSVPVQANREYLLCTYTDATSMTFAIDGVVVGTIASGPADASQTPYVAFDGSVALTRILIGPMYVEFP